jgi:hypothetical protein
MLVCSFLFAINDIELFMGPPGSLPHRIIKRVVDLCDDTATRIHVVGISETKGDDTPVMWINDQAFGTHGLFTICRYLNAFTSLRVTTSKERLAVDASLERLQTCITTFDLSDGDRVLECDDKAQRFRTLLGNIEEQLLGCAWMALDRPSLADVCWFEVLNIEENTLSSTNDFPQLFDWRMRMDSGFHLS